MKCLRLLIWMSRLGPAPHGAGGLKFLARIGVCIMLLVPPRTGRAD